MKPARIEACGSQKYDCDYRDRIYKNNGHHVIFIHAYKSSKQWKTFLLKKIMEIEEQRHDEVMKMLSKPYQKTHHVTPPFFQSNIKAYTHL